MAQGPRPGACSECPNNTAHISNSTGKGSRGGCTCLLRPRGCMVSPKYLPEQPCEGTKAHGECGQEGME